MNPHDSVRRQLVEAAAGLLEAGDLRRVQQHVQECAACRSEMERWILLTQGLRQVPQPQAPEGLVERAQARVLQQYAGNGERRHIGWVIGGLTVWGWAANVVFWISAQTVLGGRSPLLWTALWTVLAWITAGTAAIMLGHRAAVKRRDYEPVS